MAARAVPPQQREHAVAIFRDRGATAHPIAVVDVPDGSDQALLGAMNVAADHAVNLVPAGGLGHGAIAEVGQVFDRLFEPAFEIRGKLTIALAPWPALAVVPAVDAHRGQIGLVTHPQEPAIRVERSVELMAVNHEHPAPIGRLMNQFAQNGYRANKGLNQVGTELVMVAGQKHDPRATLTPRRYLFDHRGLRRA